MIQVLVKKMTVQRVLNRSGRDSGLENVCVCVYVCVCTYVMHDEEREEWERDKQIFNEWKYGTPFVTKSWRE